MPIDIIDAIEPDRDILVNYLNDVRELPWTEQQLEAFVDWRYFGRQDSIPVMAIRNNQCLAFIDSQIRHYGLNDRKFVLQESSEWYCRPKYRPTGLGVRVLQKMMLRDDPIISIRGTEASQQLLLKLGWTQLKPVHLFSKMVNLKTRSKDFMSKLRWLGKRSTAEVTMSVDLPPKESLNEYCAADNCLTTLMEPWEVEWFTAAPAVVGQYDWLLFRTDGRFSGFALVRVYEGKEYRRGQVVHFQSTDDNPEIIYRMLKLTCAHLASRGVVRILARFSAEKYCRGLIELGFHQSAPQPAFFWGRGQSMPLADWNTDFSYLRGDDAIRPFSAA